MGSAAIAIAPEIGAASWPNRLARSGPITPMTRGVPSGPSNSTSSITRKRSKWARRAPSEPSSARTHALFPSGATDTQPSATGRPFSLRNKLRGAAPVLDAVAAAPGFSRSCVASPWRNARVSGP